MERSLMVSLAESVGSVVKVQGWVNTVRVQKTMQFLIMRDHTGEVQITNERRDDDLEHIISDLTPESAVEIVGRVVRNHSVNLGQLEILPETIKVHGRADSQLPIQRGSSLEHRLDWRYLDLRRRENRLIFGIQTCAETAMREFWRKNDFIEIHTPKLMRSASESGAEVFSVEYFNRQAFLAQSPQFYKQMAMASGFDRVFEIGPVFRANPSFTSRHDTEFTSIDMEISWIESHEDVM